MRLAHRLTSLGVLLALCGALAGCGGGSLSNFDPTDLLDFLDTKKKLPGDRKAVFPEGVPGLTPGVPKDLYRGAQAEPDAPPRAAPVAEPKGRKTAKPRAAAVTVAPADANVSPDEGESAAVPDAPASAKPKLARRRTTAPPPDPEPVQAAPPPRQAPAQAASPFPAPLPSGTFAR